MARILIALLMMGSLMHAEEPVSMSLEMNRAPFLQSLPVERLAAPPWLPYAHTDIVIKLPSIPTDYVAFVSPSGGLGMMKFSYLERSNAPLPSAVRNALIVKPPAGFR